MHLKILGTSNNLPEEIFEELIKFKLKFGRALKLARQTTYEKKDEISKVLDGEIPLWYFLNKFKKNPIIFINSKNKYNFYIYSKTFV